MKLYLTSYRIPVPKALFELIGKDPKNTSVAIIPNAKDYYAERARHFKISETKEYLDDLDLNADIIDLKDYDSPENLQKALENYDFIWVSGGNTFCLRYEMRRSGFEKIIHKLLKSGMVYAGESAGAVVAGTSLKDIELADEPEFAEGIFWEGLNLIPNYILPHVGNAMFEEANKVTLENHKDDPSLIKLTDYESLIVRGREMNIIKPES